MQPNRIIAGRRLNVRPNLFLRARIAKRVAEIISDNRSSAAIVSDRSTLEPKRSLAQTLDRNHVVTYEQHRAAFTRHVAHLSQTLLLKLCITDSENFID